jgi:Peptidase family M28
MKHLFIISLLFYGNYAFTQTIVERDPDIESMVMEVSPDSLQNTIKTLVAFGTRNTLSTQNNANRGIGAAKNWVLHKFKEMAKQSAGRLTAFIDTTTLQADGRRVDRPILLGNVVATLKGTNPADKRIFIISGHLDNMRSSPTDSIGDAPGANDDGSGTAAVMCKGNEQTFFSGNYNFCCSKRRGTGAVGRRLYGRESKKTKLEY